MYRVILLAAGLAAAAAGQTQVDLKTQSKAVDFSDANPTKPMAVGSAVPAACTVGQLFFVSTAPAGQNIFACTATNVWSLEASGGGGGALTIESAGTVVGTSTLLNFTTGTGVLDAVSLSGTTVTVQTSADTSTMLSLARDQSGATVLCAPSSGSNSAYACSMSPTLTQYTTGMALRWLTDVSASGGPTTINVDFLGAKPLKLADGVTDPAPSAAVGGRLYNIWFDGTDFRLVGNVIPQGVLGESLPTCNTSTRGRLWFTADATGVKDSLLVCAKDASNAFAWRTLF